MWNGPSNSRIVRFGVFEVDLASGELRKAGTRLKLYEQPFQLLRVLLEHPGEVVTREELRGRLWPEDTFVDASRSRLAAVFKLRSKSWPARSSTAGSDLGGVE
jgi:DNA-binding response OmpR family regulator